MTENEAINSQAISECKGKANTKGTSFMGKWGYIIFLFVGNIVLYAISFRVFSAQKLQFLLLAIAFVIVNDLYIMFENNKAYKEVSAAVVKMSTEIQLYEAIGTVEECQEAMDYLALRYECGWIACEERLPEEYGEYLVAWKPLDMTKDQMIKMWGHVVPNFYEIVEYDPDDDEKWIGDIEQAHGKYEIIAWQPLPGYYRPYQHKNNNLNDEIV